jgi:hypothetical protein
MKIRLVIAELFHADGQTGKKTVGQTDRHGEVTIPNFVNAPKKKINCGRMRW